MSLGKCDAEPFPGTAVLLFKKRFLDAIRSGRKTQTIRLWPHRRMRTGQRSYIPGAGYIEVESVEKVDLEQLTDADAVPDGFPTASALRAEIFQLYCKTSHQTYDAYRIRFRLLDPAEQEQARRERRSRSKRHEPITPGTPDLPP